MENDQNAGANFALIETHLQVSNLVKILTTIPYDILSASVANIPDEMRDTQHAKVLTASLDFYNAVIKSAHPAPSPESGEIEPAQEAGNIITE